MISSTKIRRAALAVTCGACGIALASSHREAPYVAEHPKIDGTDFYLFNSYEAGREDFVTILANYQPLQDAYGGPNYFTLDPDAIYEIHIDNTGDGKADITFTFDFEHEYRKIPLTIGAVGATKSVTIPLIQANQVTTPADPDLNVVERYTVKVKRKGVGTSLLADAATAQTTFVKPVDNIGTKTIPDYAAYAAQHLYTVSLPGGLEGRLFVGQRKEGFVVNLGETFDLINIANPVGSPSAEVNTIGDANITTLALEIPKAFLVGNSGPVIGGWTTASLRRTRKLDSTPTVGNPAKETGEFVQVSRLGNPLVNEVVIGIDKKDLFNASEPIQDASRFADFVTHPTLPELIEILFGPAVQAPNLFPRQDLVDVFLLGVDGLNKIGANPTPCEMMRLNTSIAAVAAASQNTFGVLAGDNAGYPNGRRPGDDVVDISLRAAMGALLSLVDAPSGQLAFTDGAAIDATMFDSTFPYLVTPLPGSPGN